MGSGNEMELVNGRPTDTQGRLDKEIRVYEFPGFARSQLPENRP